MMMFVVAMAAIGAWAATEMVNGITWTYTVSGGSATITDVPTSISNQVEIPQSLNGYQVTGIDSWAFSGCNRIKSINIPSSVTSIGYGAFSGCSSLTDIVIPLSVRTIGSSAFRNCSSLEYLTIPVSVSKIEDCTFEGCIGLKEITLPVTITSIGYRSFYGCSALQTLEVPFGVKSIGSSAFYGCSSLTSITFPYGLTKISSEAFYGCGKLTSLDIPSTVTSVGYDAFDACGGLRNVTVSFGIDIGYTFGDSCRNISSLTLGEGVTRLPSLYNWSKLTTLSLPASLERIYNSDISQCSSLTTISVAAGNPYYKVSGGLLLTKDGSEIVAVPKGRTWVDIPDSVTSIPSGIFSGCQHLYVEHSIPGLRIVDGWVVECDWDYEEGPRPPSILNLTGVCGIANGAFDGCEGLKNVIIGEGVRTIGSSAFDDCYDLESISISSSVRTIGEYAFDDCFRLKSITVASGNAAYEFTGGLLISKDKTQLVAVSREVSTVKIPEGVREIPDDFFGGCNKLTSVSIPSSIDEDGIGDDGPVFSCWYERYDEMTDEWHEETIGCPNLKTITVASGNLYYKSIGGMLFSVYDDEMYLEAVPQALTSVTIPEGVTDVNSEAFEGCAKVKTISIPESVTYISEEFYDCAALTSFKVASGNRKYKSVNGLLLTKDGKELVWVPNALTSVTIPDGVVDLRGAFDGCEKLTSVKIPDSVVAVGRSTFSECPESLFDKKTIPGCRMVDGWIVGVTDEAYERYGESGEEWNLDLTKARGIADRAFTRELFWGICTPGYTDTGISGLHSIVIPKNIIAVGDEAFCGCGNLSSVTIEPGVRHIAATAFDECHESLYDDTTLPGFRLVDGWLIDRKYYYDESLDLTGLRGVAGRQDVNFCCGMSGSLFANGVTNLVVGDGVTAISHGAFANSQELEEVEIADSVTFIGENAFLYCRNLKRVKMPDSLRGKVPTSAFSGCSPDLRIEYYKPTFTVEFDANYPGVSVVSGTLNQNGAWERSITVHRGEEHTFWITGANGNAWISLDVYGEYYVVYPSESMYIENSKGGEDVYMLLTAEDWNSVPEYVKSITFYVEVYGSYDEAYPANRKFTFGHASGRYMYPSPSNPDYVGDMTESRLVESGEAVGWLPTLALENHGFRGWYDKLEGGAKISETTKVLANTTYYAHWTSLLSAKALEGCEGRGTVTGSGFYAAGETAVLKAIPENGCLFAGWIGLIDETVDLKNPTLEYVMKNRSVVVEAEFISVEDDWVDVWMDCSNEYVTNEEISDIYIGVDSGSLATLKVAGLPEGLKYTAKPVYDRNGELLHEANTIYGTPTKSGVYTVTVTATTAGKKTDICSAVIVVRKDGERIVKITVPTWYDGETDTDVIPGKVTGAGIYTEGKKVTLKATANKGFVFAGWRDVNSGDWLSSDEDYRSPSLSYIMTDSDMEIEAVFIPVEEDWVDVWMDCNDEYVTNEEISDIYIGVGSGSLATLKVTGLPTGLKYTAKPVYDRNGELLHEANTIYGKPTKSGVYTVTVTATTAGKKTDTCSAVIVVRKDGERMVKITVPTWHDGEADTDVIPGKVTGAGIYTEGKKVTLKATANKGFVFAGWRDVNSGDWLYGAEDYRSPSLSYIMTDSDMEIEAVFESVEYDDTLVAYVDGNEITSNATDNNFVAEGTTILPLEMESISIPKAAVSGLPAGMKYTDKALTVKATKTEEAYDVPANAIYGTPTKPGLYTVTVKLTNTTIKKAIEKKFTIEVPNFTAANGYFVDNLDNGVGKKRVLSVGITNIDEFLPSLALNSGTAKLAVSGLPSGLKYDAKTGKITGIATKTGTYTVTLTVTDGKSKYVSTITIEVEPLPEILVGTYTGLIGRDVYVEEDDPWMAYGMANVTVAANGKITAKMTLPCGAYSFSAAGWDYVEDGVYSAVLQTKNGDEFELVIDSKRNWKEIAEDSALLIDGYKEFRVPIWRNEHVKGGNIESDPIAYELISEIKALKKVAFKVEGSKSSGYEVTEVASNDRSANLTVTFDTKGGVKYAGNFDGVRVSGSTFLCIDDDGYYTICDIVVPVGKTESVYIAFGVERDEDGELQFEVDVAWDEF